MLKSVGKLATEAHLAGQKHCQHLQPQFGEPFHDYMCDGTISSHPQRCIASEVIWLPHYLAASLHGGKELQG